MATEILVDFESKKEAISTWISTLTGIPHENIRGADQTGKIQYPACVISEIIEVDTHRPLRQVEEIEGELKHVVYASRRVMLDIAFITRSKGDYGATPTDRFQDAYSYMTSFQGGLYLPETSIEYLSTNGLSILSAAAPRREDTPRDDGWQRKRIIELGLGYVHQSVESLLTVEAISNVQGVAHVNGETINIDVTPPQGVERLDQVYENAFSVAAPGASWQSFTAGLSGFLNRVEIKVNASRTILVFRIYAGEGTGGTVLSERTDFSIPAGIISIEFDQVFVVEGQQYSIYVETGFVNVDWRYNKTGAYPGGRSAISPDADHFFRTYVIT